jgi:hypothetical protein
VLTEEVNGIIQEGMRITKATDRLQLAGFTCGNNRYSNFTVGDRLCDRNLFYYAVSACVQRVFLTLDKRKSVVQLINVAEPFCAGL